MVAENIGGALSKRFCGMSQKLKNDLLISFGIMTLFAANNTEIHIQVIQYEVNKFWHRSD